MIIAATLLQEASQSLPIAAAPTTPQEAPTPVDQLWDWFWVAAPTSIKRYRSKLHSDGLDSAKAIHCFTLRTSKCMTCLLETAFGLLHHAKEAPRLNYSTGDFQNYLYAVILVVHFNGKGTRFL